MSLSFGASYPESGTSFAIFTHWSPIRSTRPEGHDPLVDLQIAPVDPVVVGHGDGRQLRVLVADRLLRVIQLAHDHVERLDRLPLQPPQRFTELMPGLVHHA